MTKGSLLAILCALIAVGEARAETAVERGKYLVEVLGACANCHTPKGPQGPIAEKHMAGGFKIEEPFGVAVTPNITPDRETGKRRLPWKPASPRLPPISSGSASTPRGHPSATAAF